MVELKVHPAVRNLPKRSFQPREHGRLTGTAKALHHDDRVVRATKSMTLVSPFHQLMDKWYKISQTMTAIVVKGHARIS
ncbi:MAG: hypothetical protein WCA46_25365 [Actinocatenispora sp.]